MDGQEPPSWKVIVGHDRPYLRASMRILFVSEQFPYPLHDGGNLRTYHILRHLAWCHVVHLVAHEPPSDYRTEALESVEAFCRVTTVQEPSPLCRVASNGFQRGIGWPAFITKNWSPPLLRSVDRVLHEETTHAIHLNMLDTACFALKRSWKQRLVFDSHNCLWSMAEQVADRSRRLKRTLLRRETRLLRRLERAVYDRVDCVLACSRHDADLLSSDADSSKSVVVPNGVDTEYFSPGRMSEDPTRIVFTGAMNYYPNVEAATYFATAIQPLLHRMAGGKDAPKAYFVGARPTQAVQALHDGRFITVTGRVDDVRPYVWPAAVFVVPILTGGGTRLKILEAFAMGKAVVSTSKGAEGIEAEHGRHLLIADEPEEFATAVYRLLSDPELRERLGREARRLVETKYSWDAIGRTVQSVYESDAVMDQRHSVTLL